jgi:hypothetical protein
LAADLAIPPEQNEAATPKGETTKIGRFLEGWRNAMLSAWKVKVI